MATIGSLGVGSGLDLNGLLDKIAAAERAPLNAIKVRQSSYNARISAYGTLKGMLSTLQAAANKLAAPNFLSGYKATTSSASSLSVAAGSTAVAGTYSVDVSSLAQSQSLVAEGVASATEDIGASAATITIDLGAITGSLNAGTGKYEAGATFAADPNQPPITISLAAGATSLQDVRNAINEAAGGAVTASIINDGTSHRLVISSKATGANSSMEIGVAGNAQLQSLIGHDMESTQAMRQTVAARNAALTVNGIDVTSASNTVAEAMQGITLNLLDTGASTVKVERDQAAGEAAINEFVGAWNKLNAKIVELTAFNAEKGTGAVLIGDGTTRVIQARLREALFAVVPGVAAGNPAQISALGVSFGKDGSLAVDAAALSKVLADNPKGAAYLMAGDDTTDGIADRFAATIDALIQDKSGEQDDGLLIVSAEYAKKSVTRLGEDYARASERIDARLEIIRAQFRQLDSVMSGMTSTSNYLTTQFANLSRQTSK